MRFIKRLAILFTMIIFVCIGAVFLALSLNVFSPEELNRYINYFYLQYQTRIVLGVIGVLLILRGIFAANIQLSRLQKEKTIIFDNPDGQVSISLQAVEDFIKKAVRNITEVKELRPIVTAGKRGISITCKTTIYADSNIPQVTEKVQRIIKSRVREMLGIEETINIKMHVTKITSRTKEERGGFESVDEETSRRMPLGSFE